MKIYAFGSGGNGQLISIKGDVHVPSLIQINAAQVRAVRCGGCHTLVIYKDGGVKCFGVEQSLQVDEQVVDGDCGWTCTALITKSKGLYVFGSNLANRITNKCIVSVACGWKHVIAAADTGQVFAWGNNRHGALGVGKSIGHVDSPSLVVGVENVMQVACGWEFSSALVQAGQVFSWGSNKYGQLGIDPIDTKKVFIPQQVANIPVNIQKIGCGWHFSMLLDENHRLWSFGKGQEGQLGHGTALSIATPTMIQDISDVDNFACGSNHTIAYDSTGIFCFGWNEHGNIGNNTLENIYSPLKMPFPSVASVAAGGASSFILTA